MHEYTLDTTYGPMTGTLSFAEYGDGTLAVTLNTDEGPERLSINLGAYGNTPPEGHIWVKDYSEHEGMAEAIEKAGIAIRTGRKASFGHGSAQLMLMTATKED